MTDEEYVDAVCVVYVDKDLYIFILIKKVKTDVDTMCGNTSLTVTQKAYVPNYQILHTPMAPTSHQFFVIEVQLSFNM